MWFSELPFLTALQTQQMFAVATNVTFLSSGANSPIRGSGGTGIFQGVSGPLVYDYVESGGTKVFVADVSETTEERNNVERGITDEEIDKHGKAMDRFTLIRDKIDGKQQKLKLKLLNVKIDFILANSFCFKSSIKFAVISTNVT